LFERGKQSDGFSNSALKNCEDKVQCGKLTVENDLQKHFAA
jgi:hypothetical protein